MDHQKQKAFLEAYEACHEPFVRYCSALAYGKMDAQDLVQEVLLSTYKHFDQIDPSRELLHYMIRAARNRSVSLWRKRKNRVELEEKHTARLQSKELSAETILEIQSLYTALNKLPKSQSEAIILFEISGFSMKEVAQIQQSTEGAVKTKISRGRQKLKTLLLKQEGSLSASLSTLKTIIL